MSVIRSLPTLQQMFDAAYWQDRWHGHGKHAQRENFQWRLAKRALEVAREGVFDPEALCEFLGAGIWINRLLLALSNGQITCVEIDDMLARFMGTNPIAESFVIDRKPPMARRIVHPVEVERAMRGHVRFTAAQIEKLQEDLPKAVETHTQGATPAALLYPMHPDLTLANLLEWFPRGSGSWPEICFPPRTTDREGFGVLSLYQPPQEVEWRWIAYEPSVGNTVSPDRAATPAQVVFMCIMFCYNPTGYWFQEEWHRCSFNLSGFGRGSERKAYTAMSYVESEGQNERMFIRLKRSEHGMPPQIQLERVLFGSTFLESDEVIVSTPGTPK